MLKSMTAYSRASVHSVQGRIVIEIHCVNRKMLDMSVHLPKDLMRFDIEIRKWLSSSIERGQVTLRLNLQSEEAGDGLIANYLPQLKTLKAGWEEVCLRLGLDSEKMVDLPFLVTQLQSTPVPPTSEQEEAMRTSLKEAVDIALKGLIQMKETEGKALAIDIQKRLKIIEENIASIELKKEMPLVYYRDKLIERLKEVGHVHGEALERVAREVALLAEKMDVTEELVRLRTHLEQFRQHLFSIEKAVGRTLDFLTQEIHREINTLGSKSADTDISLCVVKIKGELDKIREQVQNIE